MSTAVLQAPRKPRRNDELQNMGDLLKKLGDIPPERVRLWPHPGTATMDDLDHYNEGDRRGPVCELVDNTLVEKAMGAIESEAAISLGAELYAWNKLARLGALLGPDGVVKLTPDQGRAPDVAFYLKSRFPGGKRPAGRIPLMFPDFAAEILSQSNTKAEMRRKRREYFEAGTLLVWEFDMASRTVDVFHEPNQPTTVGIDGVLDGEDVLPGFRLILRPWFEAIWEQFE